MPADLAVDLLWIIWTVSWLAAAAWSAQTRSRAGWKRELPSRVLVVIGAILLFGFYTPRIFGLVPLWHLRAAWGWLLVAVVAAGFGFTWWARIHLGLFWSPTVTQKAEHRVIETGPYRFVRHPIYTGIIVAGLATAAVMGTTGALVGAALMTIGWYVKARLEEEFLRAELGAGAYDHYAEKTAMLVPFARF